MCSEWKEQSSTDIISDISDLIERMEKERIQPIEPELMPKWIYDILVSIKTCTPQPRTTDKGKPPTAS